MLIEEIKNIKSEKRDVRNFALTIGIVLGLLGGLLWWRGKDFYHYFLFISIILIFFGLVFPAILRPLQKAWMILAVILGWFMTRVILIVLFFMVITPLGIMARLLGKDFLNRKFNEKEKSYWTARNRLNIDNKSSYEQQF